MDVWHEIIINFVKDHINCDIFIEVQTIGLGYFMGWGNTHKSILVWVTRWCEGLTTPLIKPFDIKSGHYTSYYVWQHVFWMSIRESPWTHINNTKKFCTTGNIKEFSIGNANLAFDSLAKKWPMQIDKTRFKPLIKQEKQHRRTNYLCLYCGEPSHLVYECLKKCGPHASCAIFVINPQLEESKNKHVKSQ